MTGEKHDDTQDLPDINQKNKNAPNYNITSYNQSGGQTAGHITNNYGVQPRTLGAADLDEWQRRLAPYRGTSVIVIPRAQVWDAPLLAEQIADILGKVGWRSAVNRGVYSEVVVTDKGVARPPGIELRTQSHDRAAMQALASCLQSIQLPAVISSADAGDPFGNISRILIGPA